jgi:hypothetical protein
MVGLTLLIAAATVSSPSVVDAERAYAAMAQSQGQWTAFRATLAPGATLFVPDPVDAAHWLGGRKDPPIAVKWRPAEAYQSCDGTTAATTGPWERPANVGYFTTVWSRTGGEWRWKVDFGDRLPTALPPAPQKVRVRSASCRKANPALLPKPGHTKAIGEGSSPDHSLEWRLQVESNGTRSIEVYLWKGRSYEPVISKSAPGA